ncbi:DNA polymerase [Chordicoccus furentiruminis]|uniref:DNA polymerase n=1 Tax=Chordicoccus furentiruminis TaxID=2709410 RepID=UPI0023A7CFB1|nr:DNA polymerase [Chordicoccus furentiruminis]
MNIKSLSLDLETKSSVDITKCGAYKYAESPDFGILLFGVSVNNGPVTVYDLACGDAVPEEIIAALSDDTVTKWAYNAAFERVCLSVWLRRNYPRYFRGYSVTEDPASAYLDPASWRCTMIWAAYNGLPLSLEKVGAALGFEEQKMKEGKDLIRFFCTPCKPTKSNGGRTWNLPEHAPDKWELFKKYNERDVQVEMQIQERLRNYPVPDFVWDEYHLDQEINDRGIMIDQDMVSEALRIDALSKDSLTSKMQEKTGLENPNSVAQMKEYLAENGMETESLGKKEVAAMIKTAPDDLAEVLSLRLQLAKSSVRKYEAMRNAVCGDDRCHGMFQFYGANRSGRWAGRLIQLQNLPQNHMEDLEQARELVKQGDYEMLDMLYDSVPGVLSELIRTAFVPRPGYKFIVSDFSAIEARVLSHLAGEEWRAEVFRTGGDIYCASASQMFHVPVEKHGQNAHLRQKGKIAELALGYGGSVGALKAMGAIEMGLSEEELQPLVDMWRESNPNITAYWWAVDNAIKTAIRWKVPQKVGNVEFTVRSGMLFITLPSGRVLAYVKPKLGVNRFGGESVTYMGVDAQKKWSRIESYGPKFVENIVQAVSRDILAYAMRTLSHCFICGHVHDELIIEARKDVSLQEVCDQMGRTPPWIPGLLLRADGYECSFYKKD